MRILAGLSICVVWLTPFEGIIDILEVIGLINLFQSNIQPKNEFLLILLLILWDE